MIKPIFHWICVILKFILLLLLLPLILIVTALRYLIFKLSLMSRLKKSGMPSGLARELSDELSPLKLMGRS